MHYPSDKSPCVGLEVIKKRQISFPCLESNYELQFLQPFVPATILTELYRGDVTKMCMRWALQTLGSVATKCIGFGPVAVTSVRNCALASLMSEASKQFYADTHMRNCDICSAWKPMKRNGRVEQRSLYFSTLTLRVFHLFSSSSTFRRLREGGRKPPSIRRDPNRRPFCT
jgi:hypothetical protein